MDTLLLSYLGYVIRQPVQTTGDREIVTVGDDTGMLCIMIGSLSMYHSYIAYDQGGALKGSIVIRVILYNSPMKYGKR